AAPAVWTDGHCPDALNQTADWRRLCRVRAARRAAALSRRRPLVCTARLAAARRAARGRRRADLRAWRASDLREAADTPSRRSARRIARERARAGRPRRRAAARIARAALCRVRAFARAGGRNFTPERRALDRPIAMACLVDRAPCLPSRR